MTPAAAISALDRGLVVAGEDVTLSRQTGPQQIPLSVTCRARVTGYSPQQLVGEIHQGDSLVILSPTEMQARQWCWPPLKGDRVLAHGRTRTVLDAAPFYIGGELVRLELQVRG